MKDRVVLIVENVIEITRYRDRDLIVNSLGRTIFEMIPSREVAFYHLRAKRDPVELGLGVRIDSSGDMVTTMIGSTSLSAELSDGIIESIGTGSIVEAASLNGETPHTIFPVFRRKEHLAGFLVLRHEGALGDHKGLVLGMLKVYDNYLSLLDESQSDPLTGLLNRQTFDDQILKIIANPLSKPSYVQLRKGENSRRVPDETFVYWLSILDIDRFKKINDLFGHLAGDQVLVLLARLITSQFRSDDLVFRYGGEEFIVLLRAPAREDALKALERFRTVVEGTTFTGVGQVTVSIGYTVISCYQAPAFFLGHADRALYYSKEHGRNRTSNYEELIGSGALKEDAKTAGAA